MSGHKTRDVVPKPAEPVRRGRPIGATRITEPHSSASVWLPNSLHDRLIKIANEEEQSISATIRQLLVLRLK
jgi:hypothetical protein